MSDQKDAKYLGRRIGSQHFKDTVKLNKIKKELALKNQNDLSKPSHFQTKMVCEWNKYDKSMKCDKWSNILPPVDTNYNKHFKKESSSVQRASNIGMSNNYRHTQKHVSEKFQ